MGYPVHDCTRKIRSHLVTSHRVSARALLACLALLAGFPSTPSEAAQGLPDWPCRQPFVEELSLQALWPEAPRPAAGASWELEPEVRRAVIFATEPENAPGQGAAALQALGERAGADRERRLALVLPGLVERTNVLRGFMIEGIRNAVLKSRIIAEEVSANDQSLQAKPAGAGQPSRDEILRAKQQNLNYLDDAEDDGRLLCHRLAYVERKLGILVQSVRRQIE